jgi:hypothetical protein
VYEDLLLQVTFLSAFTASNIKVNEELAKLKKLTKTIPFSKKIMSVMKLKCVLKILNCIALRRINYEKYNNLQHQVKENKFKMK